MRRQAQGITGTLTKPDPETFFVECGLRSGAFHSKLEIRLDATPEEKRQFIDNWMQMMLVGLRMYDGKDIHLHATVGGQAHKGEKTS